tara:strand:- start:607 stop:1749 length:1143 start_codon:yes stop_codon:yes gene_type:complete
MAMFYAISQPSNIKSKYDPFDQLDFTVKPSRGRSVVANSFRLVGNLQVTKTTTGSPTVALPVVPEDQVFMSPFVGAHGIIKNISSVANDRILENISFYSRFVAMKTQAEASLEELTSSSEHAVELKGLQNNVLLGASTDPAGIPFSFKPLCALNRSSTDLGQSKFQQLKLLCTLSAGVEAFYCSKPKPLANDPEYITSLSFAVSNIQLSWIEVLEVPIPRTVFRTCYLTTQTVVSLNSNIYVTSPNTFDAVSCSFILQADRNQIYKDDTMCQYIPSIQRVEFTIDGVDSPLVYALGASNSPVYQDLALNYGASLEAKERNCLMSKLLSESIAFGVGVAFRASQNSKLAINIQISDTTDYNPSNPLYSYDVFLYCHGYLEV